MLHKMYPAVKVVANVFISLKKYRLYGVPFNEEQKIINFYPFGSHLRRIPSNLRRKPVYLSHL